MKLKLLSAFALAAMAMASQQAFAADGTIGFTGQIQTNTCTINGGTPNFTVQLPPALTTQLTTAGNTAGRTSFQIALTSCPAAASSVHTFFEAGTYTDASTGRLNIATGGANASGVQIQLLNNDVGNTQIKAGFSDSLQNSKAVPLASNAATLTYYAEYYATGATVAGTVSSSVAYTIVYN